jgi:hypothetical protein
MFYLRANFWACFGFWLLWFWAKIRLPLFLNAFFCKSFFCSFFSVYYFFEVIFFSVPIVRACLHWLLLGFAPCQFWACLHWLLLGFAPCQLYGLVCTGYFWALHRANCTGLFALVSFGLVCDYFSHQNTNGCLLGNQ